MKNTKSIRLLFKMGLRKIKENILQFLAIIAIGAIAVTLFVGLQSNAYVFEKQVNTAYKDGNLSSLWVTTNITNNDNDKTELQKLIGQEDSIESRLLVPGKLANNNVYIAVSDKLPTINSPYNVTKSDSATETNFAYIDNNYANLYKLDKDFDIIFSLSALAPYKSYISLLDAFVKQGGKNVLSQDDATLTFTCNGHMNLAENIEKSLYSSSYVLISKDNVFNALKKLLNDNYTNWGITIIYQFLHSVLNIGDGTGNFTDAKLYNQYLIKLKDNSLSSQTKEKIRNYFSSKASNNLIICTTYEQMPFYITLNNDVTQARQFTYVFPFVFFLVAILVILTTISQMVYKERTQIGAMKSIGVPNYQVYGHYIILTNLLVFIGTLIGEIVGPLLIPKILGKKYEIIYTLPASSYNFPILEGLLTLVFFLGVGTLVTYLVTRREITRKPVESLRPLPPRFKLSSAFNKDKEKVTFLSLKMAIRNIRFNKVKSLMVVLGVLGCTSLLVCGYGIEDTIVHGIDHDIAYFNNCDILLTINNPKKESEIISSFSSYQGVSKVEPFNSTVITYNKDNEPGIELASYIVVPNSSFYKVQFSPDTVAVSVKQANKLNVKVGDYLNFTYLNNKVRAKVGVIYEAFFYNNILIRNDAPFISNKESITYTSCYIDSNVEEITPETLKKNISQGRNDITSISTQQDFRERINSVMSGILVMTTAVKVFAILLAIVVLFNLALMNFKDRSRDIATLKVLGFSTLEISLSLVFETMTLTLFGVILGLGVGYPFLLLVLNTNIVEIVQYLVMIKPLTFVISFALTFVVAFIINFLLSLKSRGVNMVESLKSVE